MPVICEFYGILIRMFFADHQPPHFHAKYGGDEAVFDMEGKITRGWLPVRAEKLVREWAQARQTELMEAWSLCESQQQPKKIPPLE
jgi:hypothetical protein